MSILFHLPPFFSHPPVNVCTLCLSMYAWMHMCMHGYTDRNPLYLCICVCLCMCVYVSTMHACAYMWYMHVHGCAHSCVYGGQQLMSGYLLRLLSHLNLWDRFSHWTCSWPFCLGWLVSKPICSLVLGLHACLTMPDFSLGAGDPDSVLCVCTEALYLLSQIPRL